MKLHTSITSERVEELAREVMFGLQSIGLCITCGEERDGTEGDARNYPCESCETNTVFGAEELLFEVIG